MDPFSYLDSLGQFNIRPGLSRMRRALELMDNPHLGIPSVLVAGTNGKGSVCHMTDAAMSSFPYSRVLYTSPHLRSVTERVLIGSREVDKGLLGHHIERVRGLTEAAGIHGMTYFETITTACFSLLPSVGADLLISEVGLGGRWDATNVLEPQACAITSISLDHTDLLGDDVISIATEKAGIIKPSTPVVLGPMTGCGDNRLRCLRTILDVCSMNGSPAVLICKDGESAQMTTLLNEASVPDWRVLEVISRTEKGGTTSLLRVVPDPDIQNPEPRFALLDRVLNGTFKTPLIGAHQSFNTACALSLSLIALPSVVARSRLLKNTKVPLEDLVEGCVRMVEEEYDCNTLKDLLAEGLKRTKVKGRMEHLVRGNALIYLDGGHNVEAGASTCAAMREIHPGRRFVLLFSMMRDKDHLNFLRNFKGLVSEVVLTRLPFDRGMPLPMLFEGAKEALGDDVRITTAEDPREAVREFLECSQRTGLGLVAGSFYLYDIFLSTLNG